MPYVFSMPPTHISHHQPSSFSVCQRNISRRRRRRRRRACHSRYNMLHQDCCNCLISQPEAKKMRTTAEPIQNDNKMKEEESSAAKPKESADDSGRERLKKHRTEMAGRVWIPDIWGQESYLKDWVDCTAFDSSMVPNGVVSARRALVKECRRANSRGMSIENRC